MEKQVKTSARHRQAEFNDDESGTDSGCSSGGSSESAEHLPRREDRSYLRPSHKAVTRSQERLSRMSISQFARTSKSSRSWSPTRSHRNRRESPEPSTSPSDVQSNTDSDSLKRTLKSEMFRRVLQYLKLGKIEQTKEKMGKKSPKRILREPIAYSYVKGLSGLPTQRVPRTSAQTTPCSCQNSITSYRKNLGYR